MVDLETLKQLALRFLHQQQWQEALVPLHQVLQQQPEDVMAAIYLGVAYEGQAQFKQAIACYQQALVYAPESTTLHYNLGVAYQQIGAWEQAIGHYQETLRLDPGDRMAATNLGLLWEHQGNLEQAIACYRQVLELEPDDLALRCHLGSLYEQQEQWEPAQGVYEQVLQQDPDNATALTNLGVLYERQGQGVEAEQYQHRALLIDPGNALIYANLGSALVQQNRRSEAIAAYQQAIALQPDHASLYYRLGTLLSQQDEWATAVPYYQQALALDPEPAEVWFNLGYALHQLGDLQAAIAAYEQAITLQPEMARAHYNLALVLLLVGQFERGLREHEWRWQIPELSPPHLPQARWQGEPLQDRKILLLAEGGFGDTIQFVRYVPLVVQQGGRVIVACQSPLLRLLASMPGIDRLIGLETASETPHLILQGGELPEFQVYLPLMSLPYLCGTTATTIPASTPYLSAPNSNVQLQQTADTQFKLGIVWAGNPKYPHDRHRSTSLQPFLPLLQLPGVAVYSFQKGPRSAELNDLPDGVQVQDLSDQLQDFGDTAAALTQIDLLVTTDTAMAHLAGALGLPVWVLLGNVPDWRWLEFGDGTPWYPTMRLFRQQQRGDWQGVVQQVCRELMTLMQLKHSP